MNEIPWHEPNLRTPDNYPNGPLSHFPCMYYNSRTNKKTGKSENPIWCKIRYPRCEGDNTTCQKWEEGKGE